MSFPTLSKTIVSQADLPSKFRPYLLSGGACQEIESFFVSNLNLCRLEKNTRTVSENWRIQIEERAHMRDAARADFYEVRRCATFRKFLKNKNLEDEIIIPEKFLYWDENYKIFFVVSRKTEENPLVLANPTSKDKENRPELEAFTLNEKQAAGLAELAFLGYRIGYDDLSFTKDGKVILLDLEPKRRLFYKELRAKSLLCDLPLVKTCDAFLATGRLKLFCNEAAQRKVEDVERRHRILPVLKAFRFVPLILGLLTLSVVLMPSISIIQAAVITFQLGFLVLKTATMIHQLFILFRNIKNQGVARMEYLENAEGAKIGYTKYLS